MGIAIGIELGGTRIFFDLDPDPDSDLSRLSEFVFIGIEIAIGIEVELLGAHIFFDLDPDPDLDYLDL
jgi:DNA primase